MYSTLLNIIQSDDYEFDFYIEPLKVRNINHFEIESDDYTVKFSVDLDYREEETVGGDWDERLREYVEKSREVRITEITDKEGVNVELTKREKSKLESAIDEQLTLNLY